MQQHQVHVCWCCVWGGHLLCRGRIYVSRVRHSAHGGWQRAWLRLVCFNATVDQVLGGRANVAKVKVWQDNIVHILVRGKPAPRMPAAQSVAVLRFHVSYGDTFAP